VVALDVFISLMAQQQKTISKCLDPSDHRSRERQILFSGTGKDGADEILDTKIEVI
jgi:hypothetical protein